jgi:hypothetical protein
LLARFDENRRFFLLLLNVISPGSGGDGVLGCGSTRRCRTYATAATLAAVVVV